MKLSIADKLALIYSSAGSMRKTAALAGLSHQQVGRILRAGLEGRSVENYETRLAPAVDVAFDIHKDITRDTAKRHGLPYSDAIPVYTERLALKHQGVYVDGKQVFKGTPEQCVIVASGRKLFEVDKETGEILADFQLTQQQKKRGAERKRLLGDRVGALHTHWLSNRLRDKYVTSQQKSGKFYQMSVGSLVNLKLYNKQANERQRKKISEGLPRTKRAIQGRQSIKAKIAEGEKLARVFTPYQAMNPQTKDPIAAQLLIAATNQVLQDRHNTAQGDSGVIADQYLFQLDTRTDKHADKPKARANRGTNRGSNRSK